jgi:hypothetical protein
MLSRYPHTEKVESHMEEVFVVEGEPEMFPLTFVISKAQQKDEHLQEIARNNQEYSTKHY